MLSPLEEIRFWTGIMRDHGEFILTSLSFNEQEAIQHAGFYRNAFSRLHQQSKALMGMNDPNAINSLINECISTLCNFVNFKEYLLKRLMSCQLGTSLPPTFYNHMINEAMEFYKTLMRIRQNAPVNPVAENINLHLVWLPDAAGHAATIANDLDPVEKLLIKEANKFEKCFNNLTLKADELCKMLARTGLSDGVLKQLNEEVKKLLTEFICYLDKIRKLNAECKILSVLKPLIPDHMKREETYYLHKIAAFEKKA